MNVAIAVHTGGNAIYSETHSLEKLVRHITQSRITAYKGIRLHKHSQHFNRNLRSTEGTKVVHEVRVLNRCRTALETLWIAAPMIKVSCLPFRLTCIDLGADLVYSNEIMGEQLCTAHRKENTVNNTVAFNVGNDAVPLFVTSPEERDKVVIQLGVAEAACALKSALLVAHDVRHIDINMGCPKRFSVNKGMGAKLLCCPERAEDILKTLTRNLPPLIKVSCKIRLKDSLQETIEFIRGCHNAGASAVAVHARYVKDRPSEPAQWSTFSTLKSAVDVPLYLNGDFLNLGSIENFYKYYAALNLKEAKEDNGSAYTPQSIFPDGLMLARGVLWNPALFTVKQYISRTVPSTQQGSFAMASPRLAILRILSHVKRTETPLKTIKWLISEMVSHDPYSFCRVEDVSRTTNVSLLELMIKGEAQQSVSQRLPEKKRRVGS